MKRILFSLLLGSVIAKGVIADDLKKVYLKALAFDPQLSQAQAQRNAAFEGINVSRANLLPQISGIVAFNTSTSDNSQILGSSVENLEVGVFETEVDRFNYGLSLSMSLYNHANWLGLSRSEKVASQSDAQLALSTQNVISRIVTAYFNVLRARDNVEFINAEKRAIGHQLEQTRQRFEVGQIAITDVHEAQANYGRTIAQEINAKNQFEIAMESLRAITGSYHEKLFKLDTNKFSATLPSPADVSSWLKIAEEKNLALLVKRLGMEIAKEDISLAQSGHLPTLSLTANTNRSKDDIALSELQFETPYLDATSVNVSLNVPIYQGGRVSSQAEQAKFNYIAATQATEQTYREVTQSVRSSFNSVNAAISTIQALEQSVIFEESALAATEAGYEVGTRNIVEVLQSTRNLFDARRNLASARYDFIQSMVSLKQAAGTLSSEDINTINRGLSSPNTSEDS